MAQTPKCDLFWCSGWLPRGSIPREVGGRHDVPSPLRPNVRCRGITLAMDTSPLHSREEDPGPAAWGGGGKSLPCLGGVAAAGKYSSVLPLRLPLSDSRAILCPHGSPTTRLGHGDHHLSSYRDWWRVDMQGDPELPELKRSPSLPTVPEPTAGTACTKDSSADYRHLEWHHSSHHPLSITK